ncbi:helix-turn-helix domain-containing protein [Staphylococcus nepalensis]|jgi:transposase|uniref:Transposase n=1 Tax=Staphylococcus succinus TaxID=61015 RepID=A0A9Q6MUK5_9STAP|nr:MULTISPECIES: helix-turn-helix domain-containing protein [Staphylococcus]MCD8893037.1 helix-turn-helix domain-containing protein [Staphylococcus nepalensis]PTI74729.1 transposase [Staphylococcus succinus]RQM83681.1 transposase [Staphylococcus xylosus]
MSINKLSLEKRIEIVKEVMSDKLTTHRAAKEYEVSRPTIQEWVRKYQTFGEDGLKPYGIRNQYSSEIKKIAIEDVLERGIAPYQVIKKYNISSIAVLKFWIRNYNKGKANKHTGKGFSTMQNTRQTTLSERIEITEYTIARNYNYQLAVLEYDVSYQQIYNWVQKYKVYGIKGLKDRRGKSKDIEDLSELDLLRLENKKLKTRIEYLEIDKEIVKKWQELKNRNNHFH